MDRSSESVQLDVDRLTTVIEDFNRVFIRLASVQRLNFSTLSVLHSLSRGGPMRLTDLLATEQIKQPALTTLVAKLEEAGWVSRRPDPSDGRAVLLSLTAAGEAVVESRRADRVMKLTRLIDQLDDRDQAVLADMPGVLSRLVAIAQAEAPAQSSAKPAAQPPTQLPTSKRADKPTANPTANPTDPPSSPPT